MKDSLTVCLCKLCQISKKHEQRSEKKSFTVAFGRTTPIRDEDEQGRSKLEFWELKNQSVMSPKYASKYITNTSFAAKIIQRDSGFISTATVEDVPKSPRIRRALAVSKELTEIPTSERVKRIIANSKKAKGEEKVVIETLTETSEKNENVASKLPMTTILASKSTFTKKSSFSSLPNATRSIYWLKKCNASLASGSVEEATRYLREGISRKAEPTKDLIEKLKELVNEAIIESENVRDNKKGTSQIDAVAEDEAPYPAVSSSSEEFEFKTLQKAETQSFVQKMAEENSFAVSEAMSMLVRESPLKEEPPKLQCMEERPKVEKQQAEGMAMVDVQNNKIGENSSPLTIFGRMMGKLLTDTIASIEDVDDRVKQAMMDEKKSDSPIISPKILISQKTTDRSPIHHQHSLEIRHLNAEETPEQQKSPNTPWSALKKVKDLPKTPRLQQTKKKKKLTRHLDR